MKPGPGRSAASVVVVAAEEAATAGDVASVENRVGNNGEQKI